MTKHLRPLSRSQQNLRALLLGGALIGLCGGCVALALVNQDPPVDERSCPVGRLPSAVKEVVIDTTTRLTAEQAAQALAVVRDTRDRLPRFGEIVLLLVDAAHPYEPKERLALCNPGSPSQLSVIFHTPSRAQRRWREAFEKPLDAMAAELTQADESATSPLLETVTGVTWRREFAASQPNRELVLISDLRQYTPSARLNFYRGGQLWLKFEHSPTAGAADADLRAVSIRLEVTHRPEPSLPEGGLLAFWRAWLDSRGAAQIFVDGIEVAPAAQVITAAETKSGPLTGRGA